MDVVLKKIYEPGNNEVLAWLNNKENKWPVSDWDYYVMNGQNDMLVFRLANDSNCIKREFFIHALYYLVGDYFNTHQLNKEFDTETNRKKRETEYMIC